MYTVGRRLNVVIFEVTGRNLTKFVYEIAESSPTSSISRKPSETRAI